MRKKNNTTKIHSGKTKWSDIKIKKGVEFVKQRHSKYVFHSPVALACVRCCAELWVDTLLVAE